ncbi:MAG: polysaccharide biosynthesis/export family protein [Thermoanaerobaculia bacterium]
MRRDRAAGLVLASFLGLLAPACRSTPIHEINEKYKAALEDRLQNYRIKAGDSITLRIYNQDSELNQTVFVLPDGRTDPYFMDDQVVAGKSVKELEADIKRFYADQVTNPEIFVGIAPSGETIILEGEVNRPMIMPLTLRMTLMQAFGQANGYRLTACLHTIIIRRSYLNPKNPDVFRVNLRKYADIPEELFLLPQDHIIVEKNWWILIRDYVDEYVWGFLPPFLRSSTMLGAAGLAL